MQEQEEDLRPTLRGHYVAAAGEAQEQRHDLEQPLRPLPRHRYAKNLHGAEVATQQDPLIVVPPQPFPAPDGTTNSQAFPVAGVRRFLTRTIEKKREQLLNLVKNAVTLVPNVSVNPLNIREQAASYVVDLFRFRGDLDRAVLLKASLMSLLDEEGRNLHAVMQQLARKVLAISAGTKQVQASTASPIDSSESLLSTQSQKDQLEAHVRDLVHRLFFAEDLVSQPGQTQPRPPATEQAVSETSILEQHIRQQYSEVVKLYSMRRHRSRQRVKQKMEFEMRVQEGEERQTGADITAKSPTVSRRGGAATSSRQQGSIFSGSEDASPGGTSSSSRTGSSCAGGSSSPQLCSSDKDTPCSSDFKSCSRQTSVQSSFTGAGSPALGPKNAPTIVLPEEEQAEEQAGALSVAADTGTVASPGRASAAPSRQRYFNPFTDQEVGKPKTLSHEPTRAYPRKVVLAYDPDPDDVRELQVFADKYRLQYEQQAEIYGGGDYGRPTVTAEESGDAAPAGSSDQEEAKPGSRRKMKKLELLASKYHLMRVFELSSAAPAENKVECFTWQAWKLDEVDHSWKKSQSKSLMQDEDATSSDSPTSSQVDNNDHAEKVYPTPNSSKPSSFSIASSFAASDERHYRATHLTANQLEQLHEIQSRRNKTEDDIASDHVGAGFSLPEAAMDVDVATEIMPAVPSPTELDNGSERSRVRTATPDWDKMQVEVDEEVAQLERRAHSKETVGVASSVSSTTMAFIKGMDQGMNAEMQSVVSDSAVSSPKHLSSSAAGSSVANSKPQSPQHSCLRNYNVEEAGTAESNKRKNGPSLVAEPADELSNLEREFITLARLLDQATMHLLHVELLERKLIEVSYLVNYNELEGIRQNNHLHSFWLYPTIWVQNHFNIVLDQLELYQSVQKTSELFFEGSDSLLANRIPKSEVMAHNENHLLALEIFQFMMGADKGSSMRGEHMMHQQEQEEPHDNREASSTSTAITSVGEVHSMFHLLTKDHSATLGNKQLKITHKSWSSFGTMEKIYGGFVEWMAAQHQQQKVVLADPNLHSQSSATKDFTVFHLFYQGISEGWRRRFMLPEETARGICGKKTVKIAGGGGSGSSVISATSIASATTCGSRAMTTALMNGISKIGSTKSSAATAVSMLEGKTKGTSSNKPPGTTSDSNINLSTNNLVPPHELHFSKVTNFIVTEIQKFVEPKHADIERRSKLELLHFRKHFDFQHFLAYVTGPEFLIASLGHEFKSHMPAEYVVDEEGASGLPVASRTLDLNNSDTSTSTGLQYDVITEAIKATSDKDMDKIAEALALELEREQDRIEKLSLLERNLEQIKGEMDEKAVGDEEDSTDELGAGNSRSSPTEVADKARQKFLNPPAALDLQTALTQAPAESLSEKTQQTKAGIIQSLLQRKYAVAPRPGVTPAAGGGLVLPPIPKLFDERASSTSTGSASIARPLPALPPAAGAPAENGAPNAGEGEGPSAAGNVTVAAPGPRLLKPPSPELLAEWKKRRETAVASKLPPPPVGSSKNGGGDLAPEIPPLPVSLPGGGDEEDSTSRTSVLALPTSNTTRSSSGATTAAEMAAFAFEWEKKAALEFQQGQRDESEVGEEAAAASSTMNVNSSLSTPDGIFPPVNSSLSTPDGIPPVPTGTGAETSSATTTSGSSAAKPAAGSKKGTKENKEKAKAAKSNGGNGNGNNNKVGGKQSTTSREKQPADGTSTLAATTAENINQDSGAPSLGTSPISDIISVLHNFAKNLFQEFTEQDDLKFLRKDIANFLRNGVLWVWWRRIYLVLEHIGLSEVLQTFAQEYLWEQTTTGLQQENSTKGNKKSGAKPPLQLPQLISMHFIPPDPNSSHDCSMFLAADGDKASSPSSSAAASTSQTDLSSSNKRLSSKPGSSPDLRKKIQENNQGIPATAQPSADVTATAEALGIANPHMVKSVTAYSYGRDHEADEDHDVNSRSASGRGAAAEDGKTNGEQQQQNWQPCTGPHLNARKYRNSNALRLRFLLPSDLLSAEQLGKVVYSTKAPTLTRAAGGGGAVGSAAGATGGNSGSTKGNSKEKNKTGAGATTAPSTADSTNTLLPKSAQVVDVYLKHELVNGYVRKVLSEQLRLEVRTVVERTQQAVELAGDANAERGERVRWTSPTEKYITSLADAVYYSLEFDEVIDAFLEHLRGDPHQSADHWISVASSNFGKAIDAIYGEEENVPPGPAKGQGQQNAGNHQHTGSSSPNLNPHASKDQLLNLLKQEITKHGVIHGNHAQALQNMRGVNSGQSYGVPHHVLPAVVASPGAFALYQWNLHFFTLLTSHVFMLGDF
ncbi:unnamed protein product [Amoebophrya sp. A120]|nr:unnamed protein product [Amoebophrya sp. A120]|eukprot:GSA120T00013816001.1